MLKSTSSQSFAYVTAQATSLTDSVFFSVENHLVGPYDDPLIPNLTLSSKHFWTVNRYDFGEANVEAWFDYSKNNDGDIIETQNDSATLLYRKNASEPWHEIPYTLYAGSTWRVGRFVIDDVWDKEALGEEEHFMPEQRMQVFPNPAQGNVNISWGEPANGQIRIANADGKELKNIRFSQTDHVSLPISDLPQGCFTVSRLDEAGKVVNVEKLIIKH